MIQAAPNHQHQSSLSKAAATNPVITENAVGENEKPIYLLANKVTMRPISHSMSKCRVT